MERSPSSGIDVLVVGAGIGGLVAAVELFRKGHNVRVIEAKEKIEGIGSLPIPPRRLVQTTCCSQLGEPLIDTPLQGTLLGLECQPHAISQNGRASLNFTIKSVISLLCACTYTMVNC